MKKLCLLLFLLGSLGANAQIHVGSKGIPVMNSPGKISSDVYKSFKNSITLFTLQYADYQELQAFEAAISKVWKVTPFQIVKPEELNNYLNKGGYSAFVFGGYIVQSQNNYHLHLTYDLNLFELNKKDKIKDFQLARIFIFTDAKTNALARKYSGSVFGKGKDKILNHIYNEATIYNWNPGFLMGYLKKVNDLLLSESQRGPYTEEVNKQQLATLKMDTLYVPDYIYNSYNAFTGTQTQKEQPEDNDLNKYYPYPIKILPTEELSRLILESKKSIKYLVYVSSSTDKYLNVYDSKTGELILSRYIKLSYNFKNKDFNKLAKEIK